jgi:hypothetical protein
MFGETKNVQVPKIFYILKMFGETMEGYVLRM